jgi:HNH endonuclease
MNLIDVSRFMSNVDTSGDCWLWLGAKNGSGYGSFGNHMAHRWSHEHFNGPVTGLVVMHSCDTPACVKPTHLSTGSHSENMQDMARKMRNNTSKLSVEQVLEIRERYVRTSHKRSNKNQLADEYGVTPVTIKKIVNRSLWSHV